MRPVRLSARYAKALFSLAEEQGIIENIYRDMSVLSSVCETNTDFKKTMQSPIIKSEKKFSILKSLFEKDFNKTTILFFGIITKKRRDNIIDEISHQYVKLYREWKGIKTAHFCAAVSIEKETEQQIKQILQEQTNSEIELITQTKPDLLGGFILSMEGYQIDSSVKKKIQQLKKEFKLNIYQRQL